MQQIRVRRAQILLGLVAAVGLTSACGQSNSGTGSLTPDVWATVDGRQIRKADVDKAYATSVDPTTISSDEQAVGAKLNILEELINQNILFARAQAQGVSASEGEVENAFAERKRAVPEEQFQLQLTQRGLTVEDVKEGLRREMAINKLLERDVTAKVTVTDSAISEYFDKNKARFNLAEPQYRLGQIGVTPAKDPSLRNRQNSDAGSPAEARQKVDMLMGRLKNGADFGELALDFSEDVQSIAQGGDLGFVPQSALARVAPQLRDAVMKMEPGAVNLVTVGNTYTILLLISREAPGQKDLTHPTVRDGIRDLLKSGREEVLRAAYISAARNGAVVVNNMARQIVDAQGVTPPGMGLATPPK